METVFDRYTFIKRLKDTGISESQAEVMSDAFKQVEQSRADVVATKADILQIKTEIKSGLASLESRLSDHMTRIEGEMKLMRWILGFMFAGVVSLVLKAFFT